MPTRPAERRRTATTRTATSPSEAHASVPPGNGIIVTYANDGLDRLSKLTLKRDQDTNDVFSTYAYDEDATSFTAS